MGIRKFLDNTKNAFSKAGKWIGDKFHKVKNGVTKFAKVAAPIVKKGVDFISKTDLAKTINEKTGGLFDTVKDLTKFIPDGKVKDNINKFTDKARHGVADVASTVGEYQGKAKDIIAKGKDYYSRGKNIMDEVRRKANEEGFVKPLIHDGSKERAFYEAAKQKALDFVRQQNATRKTMI